MSPAPVQGPAAAAPAAAPDAAAQARRREVHEAAVRFEGVFMSMLVGQMMRSAGAEQASPIHAGLVTEKLGDQLAESGGIGLAAMLERQLDAAGEEAP